MPLIRDYVAEHERASDLGDHAIRAIDQGDLGAAREFIDAMGQVLERHWNEVSQLAGRDRPEASRCRSPLARFAGRCTARLMASSEPMRRTCRRARVTAV